MRYVNRIAGKQTFSFLFYYNKGIRSTKKGCAFFMRKAWYKAAALCLAVGLAFSSPGAAFVQAAAVETRQGTEDILEGVETKFYEDRYDDDGDGVNETRELSLI